MRTLTAVVVALVLLAAGAVTQERRPQDVALQAAIRTETVDGNLESAIKQFGEIAEKYKSDRPTAATALLHLAGVYQKRGDAQAGAIYERILREFADQKAAVAAARVRMTSNGHAPRSTALTYRRVWSGSEVDTTGGISADGRYLTYIDWNAGDLMLRDQVSGTSRRLTGNGTWSQSNEYAEQSALSRDGRQVAYAWFDGKLRYQLRVAEIATGAVKPRTVLDQQDVVWIAPYDWSADGKWIVVVLTRPDRSTELGLVGVQDGLLRILRSLNFRAVTRVLFSPDSRHLAFDLSVSESVRGEREVVVLTLDGGRETAVAPNPGWDVVMGWSPDGRRVLFSSDRSGSIALWAQPVADGIPQGPPEFVKPDIGDVPLGLTAAGALYVGVQVGDRNVKIASVDFATGKFVTSPAAAADRYIGVNMFPDWSPDGKSLSYVSARTMRARNPVVVVRSLDTGDVRELPLTLENSFNPLWAPDGKSFVLPGANLQGQHGLHRMDAQTGETAPIVLSPRGSFFASPELSPDGQKLYYTNFINDQIAIIARDLATGTEREVARRSCCGPVSLSPDGRYLALVEKNKAEKSSAVLLIPVQGGEPQVVSRASFPQALFGWVSWTHDSRQIIVTRVFENGQGRNELLLIPISGGTPKPFDDLQGYRWGRIRPHPDGRRIAYPTGEAKSEVWVLENFLPAPTTAKR